MSGQAPGAATPFATRLIAWFRLAGRRDLPWQRNPSPYRIWVSEVMLQQTRVDTVVPYFQRFMARWPTLEALAAAQEDEVLALWSGLGYYSRARNLLAAARVVVERHAGILPCELGALTALPGIGRSTAGAILALAHGRRAVILDGNVKRVLARHRGIQGWPGRADVSRALWRWAEAFTPREDVAAYTQAIMDLGATLCVRRDPACGRCPVAADCVARDRGWQAVLPAPRCRSPLPERETYMLLVQDPHGEVLLRQQPSRGLWGGLWVFPQVDSAAEAEAWSRRVGMEAASWELWPPLRHTFTHLRLTIHPIRYRVKQRPRATARHGGWIWYDPQARRPEVGMPAPVSALMDAL